MSAERPIPERVSVLVVDDDLALRLLLALLLESAGYRPVAVGSVDRALERLVADGADVVVTDLAMPGRSGLELLAALHAKRIDVPVIAMTGSDDDELRRVAVALGARAVLRKPFEPDQLYAAVAAALADAKRAPGRMARIAAAP